MFWLILCGIIGCAVGVVLAVKEKENLDNFSVVFFSGLVGVCAGLVLGGISTCIIYNTLTEDKFEYVEAKRYEIAVTESGEALYFDIKNDDEKTVISFVNSENEVETVRSKDFRVEFVDSDYHIVYLKKRPIEWYRMFVFFESEKPVIYISEDAWIEAWKN